MKRYLSWLISAAFALLVYAGLNALDISKVIVLVLTFAGAVTGALASAYVMQRLQDRAGEKPPSPPDRDSGRRAR